MKHMEQHLSIQHLDRARLAVESAQTVAELRDYASAGEAMRVYASQARLGADMINRCVEIKIRAERRAGQMLAEMEMQKPGEYQRSHTATVAPSLSDLGITKTQSSRWQQMATVPDEAVEKHIASIRAAGEKLTSGSVLKLAKKSAAKSKNTASQKIAGCTSDLSELVASGAKFGTIYADPPWRYQNQGTRASTDNHYSGDMSIEEICAMPIADLAAEQSHLHLWTTNGFLFECPKIFEAWGFEFKSSFVWVKDKMGIGNYWRNSHEILLLAVRGGQTSISKSEKSWALHPRGEHSSKPDKIRESIERLSPGPRLELFGRSPVPGWTVFGNQISML